MREIGIPFGSFKALSGAQRTMARNSRLGRWAKRLHGRHIQSAAASRMLTQNPLGMRRLARSRATGNHDFHKDPLRQRLVGFNVGFFKADHAQIGRQRQIEQGHGRDRARSFTQTHAG